MSNYLGGQRATEWDGKWATIIIIIICMSGELVQFKTPCGNVTAVHVITTGHR